MEIKEFFESFPASLVFESLEKEFKRRLSEAEETIKEMEKKYGMSLEEFERSRQLEKLGYSWEAEKDYTEWDTAESEVKFCREKLKDLQFWKKLWLQRKR